MYTLKYLVLTAIILTTLVSATEPQTEQPEEVLAAINAVYAQNPHIYHDLSYQLKRSAAASTVHSIERGRFIKARDNVYSALGPVKSLITDSYIIALDEDDQILLLSDNHHQQSSLPLAELLTALPEGVNMEVVARAGGIGMLRIRAASGEVSSAEIYYHKTDFLLEKVVLHYRRNINLGLDEADDFAQPTLEIIYETNHLSPGAHPETELSSYVQFRAGQWVPAAAYRDYTLINNLNPTKR